MKWVAIIILCSTGMSWADSFNHYKETQTEMDALTKALRDDYVPVMEGARYQFELKSRQERIVTFRQISMQQYVSDVFLICTRLEERAAEITILVSKDPITKAGGPTVEQKDEISDINRARAFCAAKGSYPETERKKKYWVEYGKLDVSSKLEYEQVTNRLSQCINIPKCSSGLVRHPG